MTGEKRRVAAAIDALAPTIAEVSRRIHSQPEIGLQERIASGLLSELLQSAGFAVEKPFAGMETAFKAVYRRGKGPVIALLAEYDALPDLGHGCGHNLVGAAACGAAAALVRAPGWHGEIWVLGTPAEETFGGKAVMVDKGVFRRVDAAMMVHPGDRWLSAIATFALEPLEFVFEGRAAHASDAPEQGINALDACIGLFNAVGSLRHQLGTGVQMSGIITEGGVAPNIVPERAVCRFYLRAPTRADLDRVVDRVCDAARGAAMTVGARVTWRRFEQACDHFRSNRVLDAAFAQNVHAVGGGTVCEDVGPPSGSTDLGNVSQVVPCIHPIFPIGEDLVCHTRAFAEAAGSERGVSAMLTATKALALTAYELLTDHDLLAGAKAEFRSQQELSLAGSQ